ncbi:aldose epimerase family protein [Pseudorhodobacter sp.]|uniref:aldose epimerase family protein n=1 Tax=Pseudorhodobacter sp. TaxID=1934400 RepID=UPI002647339C|nr:aldose epimerase family protein [Pseudorhodobacter sp.]MDN5788466.1 galactose mutarotase [Pseudorhodobacter sp.]
MKPHHASTGPMISAPNICTVGQFNGQDVLQITLQADSGIRAKVLTWGAVLQDLQVPLADGRRISTTLGFNSFAAYPAHSPYFGAVVGRYANRIAGGRFTLDGRGYDLNRNEAGRATLHGGVGGFSQRLWQISGVSSTSVTLAIDSDDGDQGFPGNVQVTCRYALGSDNRLTVEYQGQCDAATPLNLTHHSYFNLDGSDDLKHHQLLIHADRYTPCDHAQIPTGSILPVEGTRFDFRQLASAMNPDHPLDHNFVLRSAPATTLRPAAVLASTLSGLLMRVATTKPGLQVYDGHKLDLGVVETAGRAYRPFAGLCLEPQFFPNSPNIPAFPSSILQVGGKYRHETVYHFDHMTDR